MWVFFFRISSMVEKLCTHYGEKICEVNEKVYYAFPNVEKLAHPKVSINCLFFVKMWMYVCNTLSYAPDPWHDGTESKMPIINKGIKGNTNMDFDTPIWYHPLSKFVSINGFMWFFFSILCDVTAGC